MALGNTITVFAHQGVLLFRDGKFQRLLPVGRHRLLAPAWWNAYLAPTDWWHIIDLRPTTLSLGSQEILTKDRVPIRITLSGNYRVVDPVLAYTRSDGWLQRLYVDLQLALRDLTSGLTFDETLDQKEAFGERLRSAVAPLAATYGVEVSRVAVKDVTMPATIRDLMLKSLEAEKSAQATLIKTREEVAAARARANAAKLLADSPGAMRLKELETLVEISKSAGNTIVFGSAGDGTPSVAVRP